MKKLCNFINRSGKNSKKQHNFQISNCDQYGYAKCTQCQKEFE